MRLGTAGNGSRCVRHDGIQLLAVGPVRCSTMVYSTKTCSLKPTANSSESGSVVKPGIREGRDKWANQQFLAHLEKAGEPL